MNNNSIIKFQLVKASAGSGKTFALIARYISLLYLKQSPNKILALTFTNKSVNEMKIRVQDALLNLHKDKYKELRAEISKISNIKEQDLIQNKNDILNTYLLSSAQILTIDSFFNKILRLFGWYSNISVDYSLKGNMVNQKFVNFYIKECKSHYELLDCMKQLNFGANSLDDFLNILLDMYSKNSEVQDIKLETFTKNDDLALQFKTLISQLKREILNNPLSSNRAKDAIKDNINIYSILKETWFKRDSLKEYIYFKKIHTKELDEIFFKLKQNVLENILQEERIFFAKLKIVYTEFKKIKKKYQKQIGEITHNDVSNYVYETLNNEKLNHDFLYYRLDFRISHILIDEFQDTSTIQYKILQPIIEEILAGDGNKDFRTLFFVGDYKQSIYRFRGAKRELILNLSKQKQIKNASLDTNYRSSKTLIDFVYENFKNSYDDYEKPKYNSQEDGYVQIVTKKDKEEICEEILQTLKLLIQKGYDTNKIAILSFINKHLLQIDEYLKEKLPQVKTITDLSSKLINYPKVSAVVELIDFVYKKDEIHLRNFMSILEIEDEKLDICKKYTKEVYEEYLITFNLRAMVISIIKKYNLYDENIALFIQCIQRYKDIVDFVFNIREMEDSIASSSLNGVKIITIHNSKGLEFENVILVDTLAKKKIPDKRKIIYFYQDIYLNNIYLKYKDRQFIDSYYKQAINKEEELEKIDSLNTLYVASTRAKLNLFIIKKEKVSLLELFSMENITTSKELTQTQIKKETTKTKPQEKLDIKLKYYGKQNDFLKKEECKSSDDVLHKEDIQKMKYGSATHYMFECLHNLDIDSIDISYTLCKNKYGFYLQDEQLNAIKQSIVKCLENKDFKTLIENKTILKEFKYSFEDKVNIIDLLLEDDDFLYIIDYKTSSSATFEEYKEQVRRYINDISSMNNKKTKGIYFL